MARWKWRAAWTTCRLTADGLRTSFNFDNLVERVAVRAMEKHLFGHDGPCRICLLTIHLPTYQQCQFGTGPTRVLVPCLGFLLKLVSTSRPDSGTIPHYAAGGGLLLAARITYCSIHLLLILNSLAGRVGELKRLWLAG